jgi:hypothetical protein
VQGEDKEEELGGGTHRESVQGGGAPFNPTADCDDIDPYARHRHMSRCGYALIYGSEARQADDYKSALW